MNTDSSHSLQALICESISARTALRISGGASKSFYGRPTAGQILDISQHSGIIDYAPTELVITTRAGTKLADIEAELARNGQMLAFEPPYFGENATLGGTIACGFSGPRRPYAGAARDFVLGVKIISGKGELLSFGGQVMKNVAGFDVSRLMVGSLGTLAALLEVSLKVLPRPEAEETLVFESSADLAIQQMNRWAGLPLPLSAALFYDGKIHLRLSGHVAGLRAARAQLGGETLANDAQFWRTIREQRHAFFHGPDALWRLSVPAATRPLDIAGEQLIDWGGAQRWLKSALPAQQIQQIAAQYGGHATLFRSGEHERATPQAVFQPLSPALMQLHCRLKAAFDPHGIFNPGRMYADL